MNKKNMYYYWKKQPSVLKSILDNRKTLVAEFVRVFEDVNPDRIYLIGSGTSLNSARVAAPFIEKILEIEVNVVAPSRIPPIYAKKPLMVFISQGGSSANVLSAMESLSQYPSVCITGEDECEIKKRSQHHMLIGCGEELAGPKTVGYTSSVMSFYMCALESALVTGKMTSYNYHQVIDTLYLAAHEMENNIIKTDIWFDKNADEISRIKKYIIIGSHVAADIANEGALKILETIKVPAIGFEFEEYLHGPILMADEELGGLFFITEDSQYKSNMIELIECHEKCSRYVYPITCDKSITGDKILHISSTGSYYTEIFEFVLAPQLLAARVPQLLGIAEGSEIYDCYVEKYPTKFNDGR